MSDQNAVRILSWEVKAALRLLELGEASALVFVCRSGKHRSVALAEITAVLSRGFSFNLNLGVNV